MESEPILVVHNEDERRFESTTDGLTAVTEYTLTDGVMVFTHTEVPPELEGRGIAGTLVRTALEHARTEDVSVRPVCPFVKSYIKRHPEFQDLVSAS